MVVFKVGRTYVDLVDGEVIYVLSVNEDDITSYSYTKKKEVCYFGMAMSNFVECPGMIDW